MRSPIVASAVALLMLAGCASGPGGRRPVPDKLVVLTFDDSVKSHATVAAPLLRKYGFGATFFITEGFNFPTNKMDYMTWEEIRALHEQGFEIGNHTRDHMSLTAANARGSA
jgi:peptidoglycan-N-acetylglucosamine deacetylase